MTRDATRGPNETMRALLLWLALVLASRAARTRAARLRRDLDAPLPRWTGSWSHLGDAPRAIAPDVGSVLALRAPSKAQPRCGRSGVALALALALPAAAEAEPAAPRRPQVVSVITSTPDVQDLAIMGDRVFVATSGGLVVRQDGQPTVSLTTLEGLPGTRLRALDVVGESLWVAAIEGLAELRLDETGRPRVVRTFPLLRVRGVARFGGALWIATWGQGLYRLADGAGARPEPVVVGRHPTHRQQTCLGVLGDELLVGTSGAGIFRVGSDGRVRGRIRASRGLADDLVWDLVREGDRVIVATAAGLSVIGAGSQVLSDAPETLAARRLPIRDLRAAARVGSELWVATYGGGVARIIPGRAAPRRVGRGQELQRTRAIMETEDGVLVGHEGGLVRVSRSGGSLRDVSAAGLPSGDVTALAHAFGSLWVGTFGHGLARVDDSGARPVSLATARWRVDRRVNHLAATARGTSSERLWIATDRGLFWHDGRRYVRVEDPGAPGTEEHVTCLHVHPATGELWVASSRQLSRRGTDGTWESWTGGPRLPIANLHAVSSDSSGAIWVGSLHGLYRFDSERGSFDRHTVSTGALPVDWVTALVPWGDGMVAGTYHGGLSWFDGRAFRVEDEGAGLPSGWVNPHAMATLGGALWVGTLERGLVVGRSGAWHHLTMREGLPSDDVTAVAQRAGGAWVATRAGLARVSF